MDNHTKYIAQFISARALGQGRDASPVVSPGLGGGFTARARGNNPGQWVDGPARDTQAAALLALCDILDIKPRGNNRRKDCPLFDTTPAQKRLF